jgi:hypothetical protein
MIKQNLTLNNESSTSSSTTTALPPNHNNQQLATTTNSNNQFIIQNGNIYQLNANNQLIPSRNPGISQLTSTQNLSSLEVKNNSNTSISNNINTNNSTGIKNVILNNQRIKMTTIKNGTFLNLNTSKGKVIYKTTSDSSQPSTSQQLTKSINILSNNFSNINTNSQPKQIIIQASNPASAGNKIININGNTKQIASNTAPSVIVLSAQNNRNNQGNSSEQAQNTVQYIIQQKQPVQVQQATTSDPSGLQQKQTVYLSVNSPVLNNLHKNTNSTLVTQNVTKIQTVQQNKVNF